MYRQQGDLDLAILDLNKAIELDPTNAEAINWRNKVEEAKASAKVNREDQGKA